MITAYATGTLSTTGSGTEDFLSSPNVQGKFKLVLDLNDMASGDVIEVRAYKMVLTSGTQRVHLFTAYYGAQAAHELVVTPFDEIWNSLTDANAVRYSIKQTFGTAGISIPWAVLKDDALTPTTTARTLDVTATGAAGIDWANVENPTTALNLSGTNIDVDQVVASVSGAVASVTNERGKYANGAVWIGPSANTNTVSYTDGIITNPVSTIAAAKTIADALNMRRFEIIRTGTAQIGAAMVGYRFSGSGWACTTTGGSRDVGTSAFIGAAVASGTFASTSGAINWIDCEFATGVSIGVSNLSGCTFAGTTTLNAAGGYDFIDCASIVAGTSEPVFEIPAGTVTVSFRRWSGGIRITGITSATTISIDMVSGGTVTLEGADGNVQVRGMASAITDSRTGTPTLGSNAVINQTLIATPTNITAGTITTATNVTTVNGLANNVITAAAIATDAIDADALAANAVTEIAAGISIPSAATIADAVWDEATAGHVAAGSTGEALSDAAAGGGLDAAGVRAAVGLASANLDTQLGAIDDFLDTEVAAIKAKTDQLVFTVANQVDANVQYVNDVLVNGTGTDGDEWGP